MWVRPSRVSSQPGGMEMGEDGMQVFCWQLRRWFSSLNWVSCLTHLNSSLEWAWNYFSFTDKRLLEKHPCYSLRDIWEGLYLFCNWGTLSTRVVVLCSPICNSRRNPEVDCLLWNLPLIKAGSAGFQVRWKPLAFSCCITCRFSWLTRIALHGVCILYQQKKCMHAEL